MGLLAFCAFIAALFLIRHPLMQLAGNFWVVEDPLAHSDAILVLSDDNFSGDRATSAAELFRAGWAPVIVASGRLLRPYAGISELMDKDLQSRGVPAAAIVKFPQNAEDTREEAMALRGLVVGRGWHRVLLVTSNYHARRARYIFRKIFPSSIELLTVPARDTEFDPDAWWKTRQGVKIFFLETVGYCVAMWELRSRSTPSAPASETAQTILLLPLT
jgi:uncharacterized SAM-binding protein YcdF (DUF218 family)